MFINKNAAHSDFQIQISDNERINVKNQLMKKKINL